MSPLDLWIVIVNRLGAVHYEESELSAYRFIVVGRKRTSEDSPVITANLLATLRVRELALYRV